MVFAFTLTLALVTAVAFGLAPALWTVRVDLARGLREGLGAGHAPGGARLRRTLATGELALTLMLLVAAALLTRSFVSLLRWDPGFDRSQLLTFSVYAPTERYRDHAAVASLWSRLEQEVAGLPGVRSVSTASAGPMFGGIEPGRFQILGQAPLADAPSARWYDAGPGYFRVLGVPIVKGRDLSEGDALGAPVVALINQTMARRFFGDRDPVGQQLQMVDEGFDVSIVGVVADVKPFYAGRPPEPEIWWSNRQRPRWATFFVVRASGDQGALARGIQQRLGSVDSELEMGALAALNELVDQRLVGPRFNLLLVGVLALLALVLATAGVYAVLAYAVAAQRREIGIRMALGARRLQVVRKVLREGALMAATGLVIGAIGALMLSRFLGSMLYGVAPRDPATLVGTTLLLLFIALAACTIPAARASRVDPARVLRE